jgi:hypothetical protein
VRSSVDLRPGLRMGVTRAPACRLGARATSQNGGGAKTIALGIEPLGLAQRSHDAEAILGGQAGGLAVIVATWADVDVARFDHVGQATFSRWGFVGQWELLGLVVGAGFEPATSSL